MIDTIKISTREDNIANVPHHAEFYRRLNNVKGRGDCRTLKASLSCSRSLSLTFSVPQVLYGSSIKEYRPDDSEMLINKTLDILKQLAIEVHDLRDFTLHRVDLCRNIEVPRSAEQYVIQFARYPIPAHWSVSQNSLPTSAGFRKNADHWIGMYDKLRQAKHQRNGHLLRVEAQYRRRKEVLDVLGFDRLGALLNCDCSYLHEILSNEVLTVVGASKGPEAPDHQELWDRCIATGQRNGITLFIVSAMAQQGQLDPIALAAIDSTLRRNLLRDAYYRARSAFLRPLSAGSFDSAFRMDVLEKLQEMKF